MAQLTQIAIDPQLNFKEVSAPAAPASGVVRIYAKADGLMYSKDDAGAETLMSGGAVSIDYGETADITDQDYDDVADAGVLDEVARADHLHGMPSAAGGGGSPNCYEAFLTSNDALATANTFEDILSVTPPAGDYLVTIEADIEATNASGTNHTIRIEHNGTIYKARNTFATNSGPSALCCTARVTANGTNAIKLQAAANRSSDSTVRATALVNGTTNKCTSIVALAITAA